MIKGNHQRLRAGMAAEGIDAIVAFTPLNMQYLVGYQAPALILKVLGAYSATFCLDETSGPALVVGEFDSTWAQEMSGVDDVRRLQLWVEIEDREVLEQGRTTIRAKKEQFDWDQVFDHLRTVLSDRKLLDGRIACEYAALPEYFRSRLLTEFPDVRWIDSHDVIATAMEVKTSEEIAALRTSVRLAELGLRAALLDQDPRGRTASQLRNDYDLAVRNAVAADPELEGYQESRVFLTVGGTIGPNTSRDSTVVRDGAVIWIDCGVTVDGYQADIGRTIAVGAVPKLAEDIATALEAGGAAGYEVLDIGVPMNTVYETTQDAVRGSGLPTYTRGHFGHAIGIGGGEHPPFISPAETKVFEHRMVFAYERPFYVRGLGGFQFEDNLLVHKDRIERLTELPVEMLRV